MVDLHVTGHAISRYRQRVEAVSFDEARRRQTSPAIQKAAEIGCSAVKLPGGQRVVLVGCTVITVKPRPTHSRCCYGRPQRDEDWGRG